MRPLNLLVLCTGNSARSILLESILNHTSNGRIKACSAGSNPTGKVHCHALKLLASHGHDTNDARSKSWDEFAGLSAPVMDVVITVCGSAAAETCPHWPGAPVRCHWGIDDPADCTDDCDAAFKTAYTILNRRAAKLLALPFETITRAVLETELSAIGTLK